MGFFDGLSDAYQSAKTAVTQSAGDYLQGKAEDALITVGLAPSSNLTPDEIAQGATATPPQLFVGPPRAPAVAVANASPTHAGLEVGGMSGGLLIAIAALAYFMLKGK